MNSTRTTEMNAALLTLDTPVKFLDACNRGPYTGFDWTPYLPTKDGQPGAWLEAQGLLAVCGNGIHSTTLAQWRIHCDRHCYLFEGAGVALTDPNHPDKWAWSAGRLLAPVPTWNERTLRLFAADCAERVLPLFEQQYPHDDRPRKAIAAARAYARGKTDRATLLAAADAAATATAATATAATAAAYAATYAVDAVDAVGGVGGVVGAAATDDDKRRIEALWQDRRLLAYLHGEGAG